MILLGKNYGNKSHRRHSRRWDDSIKMNNQDVPQGPNTGFIWLGVGTVEGLL